MDHDSISCCPWVETTFFHPIPDLNCPINPAYSNQHFQNHVVRVPVW
uniref:Uncharacterized protein n=1 Tax=Arundo donax TaxID=35708 RepID=A0A0A9E8U8_ARUDO